MSKIKGCTNHGCLVAPLPKGAMGTNAICQCMRDPITAQRVALDRLRLMAERDRLREAFALYADHKHSCDKWTGVVPFEGGRCTCGLDEWENFV